MDVASKRWWVLGISLLVVLVGIVSMLIPPAFRIGIDFTGGSALTITFAQPVSAEDLRRILADAGHPQAAVQRLGGENAFLIRTRTLEEASSQAGGVSERQRLEDTLRALAPIVTSDIAVVSATVARETVRNTVIAVVIASALILFYIAWAFRSMPHSFRLGAINVIVVIHDAIVTLGAFSILGKFMNIEVNVAFIVGILTVLGYSDNNTVVVFDRFRENTARRVARDVDGIINLSIMETLGRSLNTSITTLLAIIALLILGGTTLQSLLLSLLIGIIVGTYSSILLAGSLLVVWERKEWLRPFRRRHAAAAQPG